MTAPDSVPLHALAEDNLAAASPDLLRAMVKTFADALMSAEADALGQVSKERVNHRNGYRPREWDTRAVCLPSYRGACDCKGSWGSWGPSNVRTSLSFVRVLYAS
ncbi:transposase [Streptomyces sp. NPDC086549]|uniref:transposase n=1 Tax=Streptomyces sp. NPDC086549 TaxID=3365752 RepID=UPI00381DF24C